jgi:hypothetical protein
MHRKFDLFLSYESPLKGFEIDIEVLHVSYGRKD